MAKYFHVCIHCENSNTPYEKIKQTLDTTKDWARYAPACWIVYTALSAAKLREKIRETLDQNDTILVIEVDQSHWSGYAPTSAIEWLQKKREPTLAGD